MRKMMFLASLALTGCLTKEAPVTTLYVVDTQHNVCSIRAITDTSTLASRWVEDKPLTVCDAIVGLNIQEFSKLRIWLKENK